MKKSFLLVILFAAFSLPFFAEQYQIKDYEFDITGVGFAVFGKTKADAILANYPIDTTKVFSSNEEFEKYLNNYYEQLTSSRAFQSVEIDYETVISEFNPDILQVYLKFKIEDSHHLLIMPYPTYSSNSGLKLKVKLKDTNFLGTLKPLTLNLHFDYDDEVFTAGMNFTYDQPFKLGPFDATWINDYSFDFIIGHYVPEFEITTGLEIALPKDRLSYVFGAYQSINKDYDYLDYDDDLYFKEKLSFSVPIKVYRFSNYTDLIYKPETTFYFYWDFDGIDKKNGSLSGPIATIGHSLSNSNIKWNNNFRKGYSVSLSNKYIYNIQRKDFYTTIKLTYKFFNNMLMYEDRDYFDRFGFYTRINTFVYLGLPSNVSKYGSEITDSLRGVRDNVKLGPKEEVPGAIVVNVDLPHHIFSTNFKHDLLNFDLQISPFFDAALIHNWATGKTFSLIDGQYCAGVEFLVFPKHWSSYTIRASAGFDLKGVFDSTRIIKGLLHNYEIFIGLGTEY